MALRRKRLKRDIARMKVHLPTEPLPARPYNYRVLAFLLLPLRGKWMVKIVPTSMLDVIPIRPPCARMISRAM